MKKLLPSSAYRSLPIFAKWGEKREKIRNKKGKKTIVLKECYNLYKVC